MRIVIGMRLVVSTHSRLKAADGTGKTFYVGRKFQHTAA